MDTLSRMDNKILKMITIFISVLLMQSAKVSGLVCYQCLDGEYAPICNLTATLTQCQQNEYICFTQVSAREDGILTSYKTCMEEQECEALEASNPVGCQTGSIDSSCTWCCDRDRCNYDRKTYSRPSSPVTTPPEVSSTECRPVATMNCTSVDLTPCVKQYNTDITNFHSQADFDKFCRDVPDVIQCLSEILEGCYHPGLLDGAVQLMEYAVSSLKQQCTVTDGCDEQAALQCTITLLQRVVLIIMSPGGSCELIMREIEAHVQCIALTVSSCDTLTFTKYTSITSRVRVAVRGVCSLLPATILPPLTTTPYTTPSQAWVTTSGTGLPSTTTPPTTTSPGELTTTTFWVASTSRWPLITTSSDSTTTSDWRVPTTSYTRSPPTESPECNIGDANDCITALAHEIAVLMASDNPDYEDICNYKLSQTIECARNNTEQCSLFVKHRIEVAIEYIHGLLGDTCNIPTAPPGVCDTKAARSCLVELLTIAEDNDIHEACRYRANASECIDRYTLNCTQEERESIQTVLNNVLNSMKDRCSSIIQCHNNETIVIIQEGGDSKSINFSFTSSPDLLCEGQPDCQIFVDFLPHKKKLSTRCRHRNQFVIGDVDNNRAGGTSTAACSREITEENWNRDHSVSVTAKIDNTRDGDKRQDLDIILRKVVNGEVVETRTLCVYQILTIDNDTDSVCKSVNDPHVHTFDKVYYNNHYQGIFRLYQHTKYPYEVQVAYQRCFDDQSPSCNCAAYVRAGDTVLVVDKCRNRDANCRSLSCARILRTELYYNSYPTPGMHIYSSSDGREFDVVFPHGTRVRVTDKETTLINVYVYPSPYDWGLTTGLCGVYDGNQDTDLIDSFGLFHDVGDLKHLNERMPKAQSLSWRLTPDEYLAYGYDGTPFTLPNLCQCGPPYNQQTGAPTQSCGPEGLVETCNLRLGTDITARLPKKTPRKDHINGRRKRWLDDLLGFDLDFDPTTADAVESEWNETTARDHCWQYLTGDKIVHGCMSLPGIDIDFEMDICVEDILHTGDTMWAPRARESVLEKCEHELRTNPVYSDTEAGLRMAELLLGAMCPGDCGGHGQCDQGVCQCEPNYSGSDCSLASGEPPQGVYIAEGGLCIINSENCDTVIVNVDQLSGTEKLACHFELVKVIQTDIEDQNGSSSQMATLISSQQLSCDLPSRQQSYKVKVTMDGVIFSQEMLFVPYDEVCFTCDLAEDGNIACSRKGDTCIEGDKCHKAGAISDDDCLVCDPSRERDALSKSKSIRCTSGAIIIIIVVVVAAVLIIIIVVTCLLCKHQRKRHSSSMGEMEFKASEKHPAVIRSISSDSTA